MTADSGLVDSLHKRAVAVVGAAIPRNRPVALLDFPRYENVGDSAIWLGEINCLAENGISPAKIRYRCDVATYNEASLRRVVGTTGVILMHGGGNFGDLWQAHQHLRENVISAFPDNPIILLPQTAHFEHAAALDRAARIFNAHPNVTILVRDEPSLALLRQEFRARSEICPDMAFCLGPIAREIRPDRDVVYLARTDKESAAKAVPATDIPSCDWPRGGFLWRALDASVQLEIDHPRAAHVVRPWVRPVVRMRYRAMAQERVRSGCRLLARGQVLVVDRLHAHILAMLLGIPHVLLDNSYGKVRHFHDAWTLGSSLATFATGRDEALEIARRMLTDDVDLSTAPGPLRQPELRRAESPVATGNLRS